MVGDRSARPRPSPRPKQHSHPPTPQQGAPATRPVTVKDVTRASNLENRGVSDLDPSRKYAGPGRTAASEGRTRQRRLVVSCSHRGGGAHATVVHEHEHERRRWHRIDDLACAARPCCRLHGGGNDVRGARGQGSPGAPAGAGAGGTHTHERAVLGIGRRRRSRPWGRRSKRPRRRRHSRARREVEREAGGRRAISRNACLEICRLPFPASFRGTRIYAPPAPPFLQHVRLAYQPPASSTFLSQQTSH
jgi:hypothetical protein